MENSLIFFFICFIILVLILITVAVLINRSYTVSNSNTPASSLSTLLEPCNFYNLKTNNIFGSSGVCSPGLICNNSGLCVADLNTPCTSLAQCSSTATVCSGRCSNDPNGELDELCPCNPGLECVPTADGYNRCKLKKGSTCNNDSQCVARCVNGFCSSGKPEGSACLSSKDCESGFNCSLGFCQLNGITTGSQNAYCNNSNSNPPICNPPLTCVDNRCASTYGEFSDNCTSAVCNLPLVCTTQAPIPPSTQPVNICLFIPDNKCERVCMQGFECTGTSNRICKATPGLTCNNNSNCVSNNCTSTPGLFEFDGTNWNNVSTPPVDTYIRFQLSRNNNDLYCLGTFGVRKFDGTDWSVIITNPTSKGIIIDFTIDYNDKLIYMINTNTPNKTIIVDSNLNPTNKFGTLNGNLIITGIPQVLNSFDIDINNDIICSSAAGVIYKNSTPLIQSGINSLCKTYGNYTGSLNYTYYTPNIGVTGVGQLVGTILPRLPVNNSNYNKIADYSIYGTDSSVGNGVFDITKSRFLTISSADSVNYQIILNSGVYQSTLTGYVNSSSRVAVNRDKIYLYTSRVCG
jgi:hypothetical protein